uniref:DH domain-containing protein n=1 Tax=Parastrongyloides trichosuri TaxID=131310 RepID=A0A0N4Z2L2_PARTI
MENLLDESTIYKNRGRRHSAAFIEGTLGGREKESRMSKKIKAHNSSKKDYLSGKLPDLKVVCSFNADDDIDIKEYINYEDTFFVKRVYEHNWFSTNDLDMLDSSTDDEFLSFTVNNNKGSKNRTRDGRNQTLIEGVKVCYSNGNLFCPIDISEWFFSKDEKEETCIIPENVIITEDMCYFDLNTLSFISTNPSILPSKDKGVTISLSEDNFLNVDQLGNDVERSGPLNDMHPRNISPELTSYHNIRRPSLRTQSLSRITSEYNIHDTTTTTTIISSTTTPTVIRGTNHHQKHLSSPSIKNIFEDFIRIKIIQKFSNRKLSSSPPNIGLPDDIRSAINSNTGNTVINSLTIPNHKLSTTEPTTSLFNRHHNVELLKMSEWSQFYHWNPQDQEWSKHPEYKKLSKTEKEKQNAIREFIVTEKNHCEVLLLLVQCFSHNLKEESIFVNDGDVNLVPQPATDNLINFHISFLASLKARMEENVMIKEISDIILKHFSDQESLNVVYASYTELCSGLDEMKRLYDVTITKNNKFSNYCSRLNKDAYFKGRDYKSCLGLLAQRCTKYPLLLERIVKAEKSKELYESACAAREAIKLFTSTIDENLNKWEINKIWDSVKQTIDKNSYGSYGGEPFTLQDLVYQAPYNSRKVVCISRVEYTRQTRRGRDEKYILLLALFDDILVFFIVKNNTAYFFNMDNHQAVFSVRHTSTRPIERQNKLVVMHLSKKNTDMIILRFASRSDIDSFERSLKDARSKLQVSSDGNEEEEYELPLISRVQKNVPSKTELPFAPIEETFGLDQKTFEKYNAWWNEMEAIFDKRKVEDLLLSRYVQDRIGWYKELKEHISSMPFSKGKQISNKTMNAIYSKFDEINRFKLLDSPEYIECMKRLEEDDCKDLFESWNNIFGKNDSDDSDSDGGRKKSGVKRVCTYGGQQDKSAKKEISLSYRRHTTVPDLSGDEMMLSPTKEDLSNFAIIKGDNSRRAAEKLLKENIELRSEVMKLRSDAALMTTQITTLKGCKSIDTFSKPSILEELREKQLALNNNEKKFREEQDAREKLLQEREKILNEREMKCEIMEKDLLSKWQAYYKHKVNLSSGGSSTSLMHDTEMPSMNLPASIPENNPYNLPNVGYYGEGISKAISNSKENNSSTDSSRSNGLSSKSKSHSSIHSDNRQVNALPVHLASKSEITKSKKK